MDAAAALKLLLTLGGMVSAIIEVARHRHERETDMPITLGLDRPDDGKPHQARRTGTSPTFGLHT